MSKEKMKSNKYMLYATAAIVLAGSWPVPGVHAEELVYQMDGVVVEGKKVEPDQEPGYYRTGGDVSVVTRQEIEDKHYANIKDAIRRIPGVQVSNPGYHAHEYGYNLFAEEISINGDSSVIILVDGKRLDNSVSSYAGNKSKTSLEMITGIANVEKIEVIKGASAAKYGSDATGGVINIITRKGAEASRTTLDVGVGSWGKQRYALTQSGSGDHGTLKYFFSFNQEESDDTWYRDAEQNKVVKFLNTGYTDHGLSFRVDKEFDKNHALNIAYSHTDSLAHYPITAPEYSTLYRLYSDQLYQDWSTVKPKSKAVGYRNWFLYDAMLGSYTTTQTNEYSVKYTMDKQNGLESFIRLYANYNRYGTHDFGFAGTPQSAWTPENIAMVKSKAPDQFQDMVKGVEFQYARQAGLHRWLTGWDYRTSRYATVNAAKGTYTTRERSALYGYVQDKLAVSDKWTVTPGVRFNHYGRIERDDNANGKSENPGENRTTFNLQSEYCFDDSLKAYASWAEVYRPVSNYDYDNESSKEKLASEEGNNWTVGLQKSVGAKTQINVNYGLLDMKNAIARYSIWDPEAVNQTVPGGKGNWVSRSVNAVQKKKSFNIGMTHDFDDTWGLMASYAYVADNFHAKNWANNPDDTNVDALINAFRPTNKYQFDLLYHKGKWSGDLMTEVYSGLGSPYYTSKQFVVLGLSLNYAIDQNTRAYVTVDNLTNTAYETRISTTYKNGAFPQPSRSFMLGVQYSF